MIFRNKIYFIYISNTRIVDTHDECMNMENYISTNAKSGKCPDKRCFATNVDSNGKVKRCCCPSEK